LKSGSFQQRVALPRISLGFNDKTKKRKMKKNREIRYFSAKSSFAQNFPWFQRQNKSKIKNKKEIMNNISMNL